MKPRHHVCVKIGPYFVGEIKLAAFFEYRDQRCGKQLSDTRQVNRLINVDMRTVARLGDAYVNTTCVRLDQQKGAPNPTITPHLPSERLFNP